MHIRIYAKNTTMIQFPVILDGIKYVDVSLLINYMYSGQVTLPDKHLPRFLATANTLKIIGLNDIDVSNLDEERPVEKEQYSTLFEVPDPLHSLSEAKITTKRRKSPSPSVYVLPMRLAVRKGKGSRLQSPSILDAKGPNRIDNIARVLIPESSPNEQMNVEHIKQEVEDSTVDMNDENYSTYTDFSSQSGGIYYNYTAY